MIRHKIALPSCDDCGSLHIVRAQAFLRGHNDPHLTNAVAPPQRDIPEQLDVPESAARLGKVGRDTWHCKLSDGLRVLRNAVEYLPGELRLVKSKSLDA